MKRIISVFLAITFVFSCFAQCCQAEEQEAVFLNEIEYKGVPETTPREASISLFAIDPEPVAISTEIYHNISRFRPEAYMRTDWGLKVANPWGEMTDEQLEWVRDKSSEILAGEKTADEKIRAVAEYVAKNVGYDYDYYYHGAKPYENLNHSAYDVLKGGSAVCYGYSAACCVLLQAAGIPCIMVESPGHEWNMAHNGQRWVLFDSTWMSNCVYEYGRLNKSNKINEDWFDFTLKQANSNINHLLEKADYTEYDNGIYEFPVYSKNISGFTIPEHIDTIGDFAFNQCQIPITSKATLKFIGMAAFQACTKLTGNLDISDAESVGGYAFIGCSDLRGISVGKKLKSIGEVAFQNCSKMTGNLNLSNVEFIGKWGFFGCESITGIVLGDKLTSVEPSVFAKCSGLREIVFPKSVTQIGMHSFSALNSLQTIYYTGTENQWSKIGGSTDRYYLNKAAKVYNYVPEIKINSLQDGSYRLSYQGVLLDEKVVVAEYNDGQFVGLQIAPLQKNMRFPQQEEGSDKIKFMIFEDASSLCPALKPVEINKQKTE